MKLAGLVEYDGTEFSGWAVQPGLRTVERTLAEALGIVLRQPVKLTVAGRTDAGVHAEQMVAHFDLADTIPVEGLAERLNAALPPDLVVNQVVPVADDFHARYSATARTYVYRIATARTPFERDRPWKLVDLMSSPSRERWAGIWSPLATPRFRGRSLVPV